jgi:hypothetical protein
LVEFFWPTGNFFSAVMQVYAKLLEFLFENLTANFKCQPFLVLYQYS